MSILLSQLRRYPFYDPSQFRLSFGTSHTEPACQAQTLIVSEAKIILLMARTT